VSRHYNEDSGFLWPVEHVLSDENACLDSLAQPNFVREQVSLQGIR